MGVLLLCWVPSLTRFLSIRWGIPVPQPEYSRVVLFFAIFSIPELGDQYHGLMALEGDEKMTGAR